MDVSSRLAHISEAIDRIYDRIPASRQEFDDDELIQVWTIYHLQIIGEAVRSLPEDWKAEHSEMPCTGSPIKLG